jgi:hypothetical protein
MVVPRAAMSTNHFTITLYAKPSAGGGGGGPAVVLGASDGRRGSCDGFSKEMIKNRESVQCCPMLSSPIVSCWLSVVSCWLLVSCWWRLSGITELGAYLGPCSVAARRTEAISSLCSNGYDAHVMKLLSHPPPEIGYIRLHRLH